MKPEAKASGRDLPISWKKAIIVCDFVRGKKLAWAIRNLKQVEELKMPVPFRKHNKDVAHKPGIGPGRYPAKVSKHIRLVLENAKANALSKGLQEDKLVISKIISNKAISDIQKIRIKKGPFVKTRKGVHVDIVVNEVEEEKAKKEEKKEEKKQEGVKK